MALCGFEGSVVMVEDGMGGFVLCVNDGRGIIGDGGIGWRACWDREFGAPCGSVQWGWLNDADKVMLSVLVIGDVKE